MTKDEALKLALEALEANQPVNYCMNNNGERFPMMQEDPFKFERNTKAIKEALAQPEQPEQEPEFAYVMEAGDDRWKKLPIQERNFCQRCGKRTADPTTIHTCTPPQENT